MIKIIKKLLNKTNKAKIESLAFQEAKDILDRIDLENKNFSISFDIDDKSKKKINQPAQPVTNEAEEIKKKPGRPKSTTTDVSSSTKKKTTKKAPDIKTGEKKNINNIK